MIALRTESKTRLAVCERKRAFEVVAQAAYGVTRLMPVIIHDTCIGWGGWSWKEQSAVFIEHKPWMDKWRDHNGLLMGIASVDDLISKITVSGNYRQCPWFKSGFSLTSSTSWQHLWLMGGLQGAGQFNGTALTAKRHSDADRGAILHGGNVSTATKHIVWGYTNGANTANIATGDTMCLVLYDMVISYDQCVNNVASQNFTNTLTALRYIGASDPGLQIMSAATAAVGTNTSYTDLKYTSIGGTAGRSVPGVSTFSTPIDATAPGAGYPSQSMFANTNSNVRTVLNVPLVNGDQGCKQLDSYQMAASNADLITFILGFQLAWFPVFGGTGMPVPFDFTRESMPRIRDGACLTFAHYGASANNIQWMGQFDVAWG